MVTLGRSRLPTAVKLGMIAAAFSPAVIRELWKQHAAQAITDTSLSAVAIVPTLQEEDEIEGCLRCLRDQTVPCRVVVVDGGSTDQTVPIARRLADEVLITEKGVLRQRDAAIRHVQEDIILKTDADTHVPSHWVARMLSNFTDLRVVAVGGPHLFRGEGPISHALNQAMPLFEELWTKHRKCLTGVNCAFRREAYLKIGPGDMAADQRRGVSHEEEVRFTSRMKRLGRVVWDPGVCVETSARRANPWSKHATERRSGLRPFAQRRP